jgi:hypothetical protein
MDPCFKFVPQCNQMRKVEFEIRRSGSFGTRPLAHLTRIPLIARYLAEPIARCSHNNQCLISA